ETLLFTSQLSVQFLRSECTHHPVLAIDAIRQYRCAFSHHITSGLGSRLYDRVAEVIDHLFSRFCSKAAIVVTPHLSEIDGISLRFNVNQERACVDSSHEKITSLKTS